MTSTTFFYMYAVTFPSAPAALSSFPPQAGLVSTALTGFIVPFHGFQAQTVDPTVQVLALIAMQLNVKLLMTKGEAWSCAVKRSCHGRSSPIC